MTVEMKEEDVPMLAAKEYGFAEEIKEMMGNFYDFPFRKNP